MRVHAVLIIVAICINAVAAQISSHFSSRDQAYIAEKALSSLSSSSCLRDIYYSIDHLRRIGHPNIPCDCKKLRSLLTSNVSAYDGFYGLSSLNICDCGDAPIDLTATAQTSIQSTDLMSITGGVLALNLLGKITAQDKQSSMNKLVSLMTKDGKFKLNRFDDDSTASIQNLHHALEMLSSITSDNDASDFAADVFEKAFGLIPTGSSSEFETDALLMVLLSKLTDKKLRLMGHRLVVITEILLNLKLSSDIVVLSHVYEAFRIIAAYKASPVHMYLETTSFQVGQPSTYRLQLRVKDVFGVDLDVDHVELSSLKGAGKDSSMLPQGTRLQNNVLDMSTVRFRPGRYAVAVSVLLSGRPKPNSFHGSFVVRDLVEVRKVFVGVADSSDMSDMNAVKTQNSLSGLEASATNNEKLLVDYDVLSTVDPNYTPRPHQAVVKLTNQQSGKSAYFVSKKVGSGGGDALKFSTVINLATDSGKLDSQSGDYVVSIAVGDSAYESAIEWVVGDVYIAFANKPKVNKPLYKESLLHTSDNTLEPLPEIAHLMRPDAKRASDIMATIFTALTWVPLLAYVIFVLSLSPNLMLLASLPSLSLLTCFAAILSLYISYWLALDGASFYETIRYLCFLFPTIMIVGRYSLMVLTANRLGKEKKVKGKSH